MVGYILSGILLLILAAVLVRRYLDMKRLDRLSEKMEDYLTGNGGDLSLSLKEDKIAQVENAALELQNRIETAEDRFRQEARRTSNLTADMQIAQIERMETLISSLLRLEKLCADGYEFAFEECNVRKMIEKDWEQMHSLWPYTTLTIEGEAVIRCDEKWLSEAFRNLIKNACEHTGENGHIHIFMERTESFFYCTLEDNGGGAAAKDLPHLFERFYRAEGQHSKGAGLGLAIVKEIIYRHHGQIIAQNTDKGLKFTISLPVLDMIKTMHNA